MQGKMLGLTHLFCDTDCLIYLLHIYEKKRDHRAIHELIYNTHKLNFRFKGEKKS